MRPLKLMQKRQFLITTAQSALAAALLGNAACAATGSKAKGDMGAGNTMNATNVNILNYPLREGWVDNWLGTDLQVVVIPNGNYKFDPKTRPAIVKQFLQTASQVTAPPIEGESFSVGGEKMTWNAFNLGDDHLLDQAVWFGSSRYMRAWSFVQLHNDGAAREVSFQLFTNGPADVWIGDAHVHRTEEFDFVNPNPSKFSAKLEAGDNSVLVRREHVVALAGAFVVALRLTENGAPVRNVCAQIPTHTSDVARRQRLEAALERAYLSRDNYGPGQSLALLVPQLEVGAGPVKVALQRYGKTIKEAVWDTDARPKSVDLGEAKGLSDGNYQVEIGAGGGTRALEFRVTSDAFLTRPQAGTTVAKRRQEVLQAVAARAGGALDPKKPPRNLLWKSELSRGEMAKMELGRWQEVNASTWMTFIEGINRREDGADFRMIDLLTALNYYGGHPSFPANVKSAARDCILGWRYWQDEPGTSVMNFGSENHQLASHGSEILAGQMFPDETFVNNGKTGDWHRQHGEKLTLTWLEKRAAYGFEEWDANGYLAADTVLLASLANLAQNSRIKKLSAHLIDVIFLSLALNSYKGSFGSTHGRTGWEYIRDSRSEPIAPLTYYGWGLGVINDHADEALGVAIADYQVPDVIAAIALDEPQAFWNRERQGLDPAKDKREAQGPTDKVTYKTPDFMLASAQSWRPGKSGYQQHIWQATLGPDAVCFATSPAFLSTNGNNRPNFWNGNKTLPRVAQWKDFLIAVHRGRKSDWLDFTHAYFPTWAYDEYRVTDTWAFARKGDGYLAIRAANGLNLMETGDFALRELRSPGRANIWLCQMGRRAQDGEFAAFQARVAALPVKFDGSNVTARTLRDDELRFGWDGPLLLNGREQPISDFPRFDNPYVQAPWPASELEVRHGKQELVLDFANQTKIANG